MEQALKEISKLSDCDLCHLIAVECLGWQKTKNAYMEYVTESDGEVRYHYAWFLVENEKARSQAMMLAEKYNLSINLQWQTVDGPDYLDDEFTVNIGLGGWQRAVCESALYAQRQADSDD